MAIRIDGKALAAKVKDEVRTEAAKLPRKPGLAVILVGDNQASQVYVRGKEKDLAEVDASQLRIVADMSEITTVGTYSIPVKVYLDASSSVGIIGEYSIVVNISR